MSQASDTIISRKIIPRDELIDLQIESPETAWQPTSIQPLRTLGSGRAARAILVRATGLDGDDRLCVEKIFSPGLLTRFIYRCCFQASFPYQTSSHAILACYHRRRVAARLIEAFVPDARIAEPLYVRWDDRSSAYVLGAEFIDGRGIRPAASSPNILRGLVRRSRVVIGEQPVEEIDQLLDVMNRLETMLRQSGLVGSGWQVSKAAVVSTANLLKTDSGYVVVDLESGIPAMLVAHYVMAGFKIRSLPLFDDVDSKTLSGFLAERQLQLRSVLSQDQLGELMTDAEKLVQHSEAWKNSEISIFRQGLPFVSSRFQNVYRKRCIDHWHQTGRTDDKTHRQLKSSKRLYSRMIYLAGIVPGTVGASLQKFCGNGKFRTRLKSLVFDHEVRKSALGKFVQRKSCQFAAEGRISKKCRFVEPGLSFQLNWLMSKVLPSKAQRWLTDREWRRNKLTRIMLMVVSGRFQRAMGQLRMQSAIRSWERDGRLQPGEYNKLLELSGSHEMDEYSRCFGMHLSVKLSSPLLIPLKVGGVAAFVASGNVAYLIPMFVSPALRTLITCIQMFRNARYGTAYGEALLVGMLPVVGTLAFPVQMYSAHRKLATFLIRDATARLSRVIPIYGGKDSRLEIFAIKAADVPIEIIDVCVNMTSAVRRLVSSDHTSSKTLEPVIRRLSRWDVLADEQLRLCRVEEQQRIEADLPATLAQGHAGRRAA